MTYLGQNKEKSLFCLISFLIFAIMFYTFWPKQNNCSIQDYSKLNDIALRNTNVDNLFKPIITEPFTDDMHKTTNIHSKCKYNTAVLIQSMQTTQRNINKLWQNMTQTSDQRWNTMTELFESAALGYRLILQPFTYYSGDENKYFLDFTDPNASCNAITIGVGGTWRGEIALRKKYPQCDFVGIDPSEENRKLVESMPRSRFFLAALHEKEGNFNALKIDPKEVKYVKEMVHHQALYHVLILLGNGHTFDFMTIDTEGAEFSLMKTLHTQRHLFAKICQFNLEIHYAKQHYDVSLDEFDKLFSDFLDEAHFVLLSVTRFDTMRRLWFLNVSDQECIEKFLC